VRSGSVFSVGEPLYNYANAGHTNEISLFFALESGLPKDNYLLISLPSAMAATLTSVQWTDAPATKLLSIPTASLFPATVVSYDNFKYLITF
jgi:hypothetical protein